MKKAEQQVLDLQGPVIPTFDNYIVGPNEVLLAMLQQLVTKPQGWHYLSGRPSTGKTHLLLAMMQLAEAQGMDVCYLPLASKLVSTELINQVQTADWLLLDDIHAASESDSMQEAIFHCLNRMHQQQQAVIITGNTPIDELGLQLPDLKSRLSQCQRYRVKALDDEMLSEFMRNYFNRYGLPVEQRVIDYCVKHGPRNMRLLLVLLQAVVQKGLQQKRNVSVRLISSLIK